MLFHCNLPSRRLSSNRHSEGVAPIDMQVYGRYTSHHVEPCTGFCGTSSSGKACMEMASKLIARKSGLVIWALATKFCPCFFLGGHVAIRKVSGDDSEFGFTPTRGQHTSTHRRWSLNVCPSATPAACALYQKWITFKHCTKRKYR
jgi:hypothetical protein